jgi:hypothetical protein
LGIGISEGSDRGNIFAAGESRRHPEVGATSTFSTSKRDLFRGAEKERHVGDLAPLRGTVRTMKSSNASGKCLCGAVRFTATGVEPHFHACHCGMCRRWSGGAPFLAVSAASVQFEGVENLGRYESSDWAQRGFCRLCGSSLFYFLKPAQTYALGVGAFDDASAFDFAREIFIDHKPASYAFAGERPRLTEAETLAEFAPPEE